MPEYVMLDDVRVTVLMRDGRPRPEVRAAVNVLSRGGFVPRLRKLARELARQYPELRGTLVRVAR
jgi:hypothetical protein